MTGSEQERGQEVVPATPGAHLDQIAAVLSRPGRQTPKLVLGSHAPTSTRKARTKDEAHMAQRTRLADRTCRTSRYRAVQGDPHQFALCVTHLGAIQLALAKGSQPTTPIEAVVDRAGSLGGDASTLSVDEMHHARLATAPAPAGEGPIADIGGGSWCHTESLYRFDIGVRYIDSASVQAVLETAVLGFLIEGDLHGYELKKRLTELLGTWSSVSFGSLYPALARLERAGSVRSVETGGAAAPMSGSLGAEVAAYRARTRQGPTNRRARKVYSVTDAGRARLARLLDDHTGDDRSFAVRVAFCRNLPGDSRLALFRRRRADLVMRLHEQAGDPRDRGDSYRRSLVEFQHERLLREQAWLDRLIEAEINPSTPSSTITLHGGSPT